ncbi:MAG: folylpolyglutamate synthase/dihydrofolate synthase family protein [Bacillota bacterium]|nr:folylpolyglutamate synthase/dihydrofolate synthase family protein [Bacillota bacterium]
MDFTEAKTYITSALRFGIKPGLHRMHRLLQLLNNPQQNLRCIHIAGTNGKGSTTAFCAAILAAAGHRVGIFTSPYLVRLTERIRIIDGPDELGRLIDDETTGEISPDDFARLMTRVRTGVETMLAEGEEHPTEFELLTAIGFLYFAERACDLVVLETGLGGRLDSTNVIEQPLACIITALGYDHMDRLGSTLAEIAAEKAGIIKPGCPVFLYNPHDLLLSDADKTAALQVINRRCKSLEASLETISWHNLTILSYDWTGQLFTDNQTGLTVRTTLLSLIQPMNACLAMRACRALGLADDEQIRTGINVTRWPARMELLRRNPPILLDGAHNPQGCKALADSLNRLLPDGAIVFLAGMLADKDYQVMLQIMLLETHSHPVAFICVKPDSLRALPAEHLADAARKILQQLPDGGDNRYNDAVWTADTPEEGARLAVRLADEGGHALCAFGSLYMVGSIRQILKIREE